MASYERSMSMDAARARFPECPVCNEGVDENDPDTPYEYFGGEYYHTKCTDAEPPEPNGEEMCRDYQAEFRDRQINAMELKR